MKNKYEVGQEVRFFDNQEVGIIFDIEENIYWIEVSNGSFAVIEDDIDGVFINKM